MLRSKGIPLSCGLRSRFRPRGQTILTTAMLSQPAELPLQA